MTRRQNVHLFHAVYDNQTSMSQLHASPHHSNSGLLYQLNIAFLTMTFPYRLAQIKC